MEALEQHILETSKPTDALRALDTMGVFGSAALEYLRHHGRGEKFAKELDRFLDRTAKFVMQGRLGKM